MRARQAIDPPDDRDLPAISARSASKFALFRIATQFDLAAVYTNTHTAQFRFSRPSYNSRMHSGGAACAAGGAGCTTGGIGCTGGTVDGMGCTASTVECTW